MSYLWDSYCHVQWWLVSFIFHYHVAFHCMDIPQVVYPSSCWWTFGSCPFRGHVKSKATVDILTHVCWWTWPLVFLGYLPKSGSWVVGVHMALLSKCLTTVVVSRDLPSVTPHFRQQLILLVLDECRVKSCHDFNVHLHFLDEKRWWAYFVCHYLPFE